jgi:sporulation related protein
MMRLVPRVTREHYMTSCQSPRALLPVLLMCLAALSACSRETDDWRAAQAADTVAAYEQFSREHPASAHATEATARAAQLVEDEDWRRAQEQDTLQAYQLFQTQHPDSRWTQEARVRVETITLGSSANASAAPAEVAPEVAPAAVPAVAPAPRPKPTSAPAPAVAAVAASGFGVQLGAFTSEAAARSQWDVIAGKHPAQLKTRSPRVTAATTSSGRLFRLQTGTRTEAEARELCRNLAAAGQACVVVHP